MRRAEVCLHQPATEPPLLMTAAILAEASTGNEAEKAVQVDDLNP